MLVRLGSVVVRCRWAIVAAGITLVAVGLLWGTGVFGLLSNGGFDDPRSESSRARARIAAEVGRQSIDVVALYSSAELTVDDERFRTAVETVVDRIRQRPEVERVVWLGDPVGPGGTAAFVSGDRHATYVAVMLRRAGSAEQFSAVEPDLRADGLTTQVGGPTAIFNDVTEQIVDDIARAEMLSMPVLLVLLVAVFRSVVAAMMPLLVGGLAILGAFVVVRLLTYATEVSIFAINVVTLLGLGLAIDYSLFVVGRFREEVARGTRIPDAVVATMATAGRTVLVSGSTIALALASLLVFPQMFLRSMGLGGVAAVVVAIIVSLTVLPALLAVLGSRLNAWRPFPATRHTPRGQHRRRPRGAHRRRAAAVQPWARIAYAVMRRPWPVIVGTVAVLALLTAPFQRAVFGDADELVLPAGTESRVVSERIDAEFPAGGDDRLTVLVSGVDPATAAAFARRIALVPNVRGAAVTATRDASSVISVSYSGESGGPVARAIVVDIRALHRPAGAEVLVGGSGADTEDLLDGLAERLPVMALLVALSTMLLLFLAFRSVLLPVKAVLMNLVSIGASFGVIVWIFQDGHLAGALGFTPSGDLPASQLIMMLALLFGLSTDYEVFLLSRVREEWQRTGDNVTAVAAGLQRTGGIITSAALLLVVVVGGFAAGGISFIKLIGVGMIVAIVIDATIVRALLVPATMRVLGRANWWAPRLTRRQSRPDPRAGSGFKLCAESPHRDE
jgi:trehalose monomycolate/heme transporter